MCPRPVAAAWNGSAAGVELQAAVGGAQVASPPYDECLHMQSGGYPHEPCPSPTSHLNSNHAKSLRTLTLSLPTCSIITFGGRVCLYPSDSAVCTQRTDAILATTAIYCTIEVHESPPSLPLPPSTAALCYEHASTTLVVNRE